MTSQDIAVIDEIQKEIRQVNIVDDRPSYNGHRCYSERNRQTLNGHDIVVFYATGLVHYYYYYFHYYYYPILFLLVLFLGTIRGRPQMRSVFRNG